MLFSPNIQRGHIRTSCGMQSMLLIGELFTSALRCLKHLGLKYERHIIPSTIAITDCFDLASENGEDLLHVLTEKEFRESWLWKLKILRDQTQLYASPSPWFGLAIVPFHETIDWVISAWSECTQSISDHIREVKITLIMHQLMDQIILSCVPLFTHFYLCPKLYVRLENFTCMLSSSWKVCQDLYLNNKHFLSVVLLTRITLGLF